MTIAHHFDAVVVGLGGVGTFALRALAKERGGGRFLGLEQGSFVPSVVASMQATTAGHSSLGKTRIYRRAYFEHVQYVPWIEHSISVFRELQQASGVSLLQECGTLLMEPALAKDRQRDKALPPLLASSWNSAQQHSIPVEYLDSSDLSERFQQFHTPNAMVGVLEPGGGFLRPERIMKAALQEAMSLSGNSIMQRYECDDACDAVTIWEETSVLKCVTNGDGRIELHLQESNIEPGTNAVVTTDKLLLSMGAWTTQLIPSWHHMLYPVRQVQGWIDTKCRETDSASNPFSCRVMPTFVYVSPDWPESLYGVPCDDAESDTHEHEASWLKVGIHKQRYSPHFSFADHPSTASSAEIKETQSAITHCISPSAWSKSATEPSLIETKPCLYTMTPDTHFVIGEPHSNVFAVAGLSGHGYKMTPALGQMMADYALGKDVGALWRTDFCSPHRFRT